MRLRFPTAFALLYRGLRQPDPVKQHTIYNSTTQHSIVISQKIRSWIPSQILHVILTVSKIICHNLFVTKISTVLPKHPFSQILATQTFSQILVFFSEHQK